MANKISRRQFLKTASAAAAASTLPLGLRRSNTFAVRAQDASVNTMMRSSFITTNNDLQTSLFNDWAGRNGVSLDLSLTQFGQLSDTLATAAATGDGPNVMHLVHIRPHQFAEVLVDVSDIAEEIGEANGGWYDVARDICVVDGVWRAVPHFLSAHAMIYRQDLFSEAGFDTFPETWEGLLEAGTELKNMGAPLGFSLGRAAGDGNNFIYSLLWSFGGSVTDEEGVPNLDTPETRQAIEFVAQLYNDALDPGVLTWDDGANNRAFLAGEVSCTNNASSILWAGRNQGVEFVDAMNHAPYPAGPAGTVQFLEMTSLGILNYTEDVEAAKGLISYINSPDVWLPLGVDGFSFYYPLLQGYEDNPAMPWNFDPKLEAFKGLAATGQALGYPASPSAAASEVQVNFIINDMFGSVAAGAASVDEAIETASEQVNEIFGM